MEMIAQLRWQDGVDIGIITFLIYRLLQILRGSNDWPSWKRCLSASMKPTVSSSADGKPLFILSRASGSFRDSERRRNQ
jgi:hypothetical protein